jgi:hypothetical protein
LRLQRIYRLTLPFDAVDEAATPPPVEPERRVLGYEWAFDEPEFDRIPALRGWIAAETEATPEEQGFVRPEAQPGSLSLLTGGRPGQARVANDPRTRETCPACGLVTIRLGSDGPVEVEGDLSTAGISYLADIDSFAGPAALVDDLVEAGLGEGLSTLEIGDGKHRLLAATTSVGDPVAPFGTTGEICKTCKRAGLRADDRTYPGLPRYSFYYLYERPEAELHWVWSTIDGQTRPMVARQVAEWLTRHDETVNLQQRGWYPDELEDAFLEERYR